MSVTPSRKSGLWQRGWLVPAAGGAIALALLAGSFVATGAMAQAPPAPQFQYIGMIARQRFNNDTAYFQEQGKPTPLGARLNDVVGGRFRLISISAEKTIFEDVNLGFRHPLALYRPTAGQTAAATTPGQNSDINSPGRFPNRGNPNPNMPGIPFNVTPGEIPGIPGNIPVYIPPTPQPNVKEQKDEDDDGNR